MAADMAASGANYHYVWEEAFCNAILETNNSRLGESIVTARNALLARRNEVGDGSGHSRELKAIDEALRGLVILDQERLSPTSDVIPQVSSDDFSELCRKAATEKDPDKLTALIAQINIFLRNKDSQVESDETA